MDMGARERELGRQEAELAEREKTLHAKEAAGLCSAVGLEVRAMRWGRSCVR